MEMMCRNSSERWSFHLRDVKIVLTSSAELRKGNCARLKCTLGFEASKLTGRRQEGNCYRGRVGRKCLSECGRVIVSNGATAAHSHGTSNNQDRSGNWRLAVLPR